MKSIKFSLLSMVFVTGPLFAMEDQESSNLNLSVQDEFSQAIRDVDPARVEAALARGANPNIFEGKGDESVSFALDHILYGSEKECFFYEQDQNDKYYKILEILLKNNVSSVVRVDSFDNEGKTFMYCLLGELHDIYNVGIPISNLAKKNNLTKKQREVCLKFTDKEYDKILPMYRVVKLFFDYGKSSGGGIPNWNRACSLEDKPEAKEDWAKVALLLFPDVIENEKFASEREYLEKIKCKCLKDNSSEYFKKRYGSTFNYIRQRQYGIPPRKNRTFSKTNDSNNNSKEEQTACAQKRKFPDYI